MLNLVDSLKLLERFPIAKYKIIENQKDLSILQFPYWMKASISEHKLESGAVLKCQNLEKAKENFSNLKRKFNTDIIIQESVEGTEMIMGLKNDKVFGKLLMLGFGGTNAEVLKDVSFRALPVDRLEIGRMLKELKLFPALIERKKHALDRFITLADRIAQLKVREMDLNPVILNEKDATIVDARIEN